jgi:neutral ceramidase
MDHSQLLKAGPSEGSSRTRAPEESSRWRRLARLIYLLLALSFAYSAFHQLHRYTGKQLWLWGAYEGNNYGPKHQDNVPGSLYLLGVGKADITGSAVCYTPDRALS